MYCTIDGLFSSLPQYWVLPSHELSNSKYRNAHDNRNLWQWLIYPILSQCSIFYPRKTSENHTVFKSFQEFKNETLAKYGLRLISQWAIRSSETMLLANPDIVNEFYEHPTRFKSIPMQLYTIHSECHHPTLGTLEWKGNWILVRYMKVYIWWSRHLLFSVFEVFIVFKWTIVTSANTYSLIPKVDESDKKFIASYVTKSIYEIFEMTSLYKEVLPVLWIFFCEKYFSKIRKMCA